ncbi:long-chain fatty acid--CoA ligase [Candidatus Pacearchaeota archaeon]|nr:long-chain fatty acid--CoA ligase [Candidatus Pacearchaeota archaeon]
MIKASIFMGIYEKLTQKSNKTGFIFYKVGGSTEAVNYKEFFNITDNLALYLSNVGVKKGDRIGIYMKNSPHWLAIDLACLKIGAVSVPIGTTVSEDNVKFIIRDANLKILFKDTNRKDNLFNNEKIIDVDRKIQDSFLELLKNLSDKKSLFFKTRDSNEATVCYTSGSTGRPKGAILTHGNIIHNIENQPLHFDSTDTSLSFLPLSHMFERTCGVYFAIYNDVTICFAESIDKVMENVQEFKPTYFLTVPRLLEKIYNKANEKAVTRLLVSIGLGKIVGKKIRAKLGGRIRFIASGGAPLSKNILEFFKKIGIIIYQGYGLTETSPLISVNYEGNNVLGSVGKPLKGVEVKLSEENTLMIRSPGLMKEYTKKGEMQKRMKEGWFDTGDLAEVNSESYIFIKGRIDDLIVMSNGKKVYPDFIEKEIENNGIDTAFVYGNGKNYLCTLIYGLNLNKEQIQLIIDKVNKKLSSFEAVKKFYIIPKAFSIEEGTLTPTLKKQRKKIIEIYYKELESLYNG